jgi:hypothetical protein
MGCLQDSLQRGFLLAQLKAVKGFFKGFYGFGNVFYQSFISSSMTQQLGQFFFTCFTVCFWGSSDLISFGEFLLGENFTL